METNDRDNTRNEREVRDRVDFIFENYSLEEILEMNDITPEDAVFLLYMNGHIKEPEAYFP